MFPCRRVPLIEMKESIQTRMYSTDFGLQSSTRAKSMKHRAGIKRSVRPTNICLLGWGDTHGRNFGSHFMTFDLTRHYSLSVLDDSLQSRTSRSCLLISFRLMILSLRKGKPFRPSFSSLECVFPGTRMRCSGNGRSKSFFWTLYGTE